MFPFRLIEYGTIQAGGGPLAFSPDGRTLAVGSGENAAALHEVASLLKRGELPPPAPSDGQALRLAFLNNGRRMLVGHGARAVVRGLVSRKPILFCPVGRWWKARPAVATAGALVAIVWQHRVVIWDARAAKRLGEVRGRAKSINAAALSPDGKFLATASDDETARLWGVPALRERAVLRGHDGCVDRVDFSPCGKALMTAGGYSGNYSVCLRGVPSGKKRLTWDGHQAAFLWRGRYLAVDADSGVRAFGLALPGGRDIPNEICASVSRMASTTNGGFNFLAVDSPGGEVSLYRAAAPVGEPPLPSPRKPRDGFVTRRARGLWEQLASNDAARAWRAIHGLAARPKQALLLLGKELRPAKGPLLGLVGRLGEGLVAEEFEARMRSEAGMLQLGEYAIP